MMHSASDTSEGNSGRIDEMVAWRLSNRKVKICIVRYEIENVRYEIENVRYEIELHQKLSSTKTLSSHP
jgi:uncharacterized membrane-anchored protein YhcB (DUF1043 family)